MKLIAAVLVAIIVCMLPGAAQAQCSGQFAPGTLCGNATGSLAPPRSVAAGAFGFITVTVVQGDLVYGSASGVLSALPKDTNATRYLSNTGTSNNPAWAQVSLTSGVTGNLPLANIAQSAANTMLGNWTGSTANVAANAMISCPDTGGNHLNYVSGTGITCGTSGGASGITTLTGDVTASGSGSVVATLATVASAGTTGSSTAIPVITINAKGLTTSITTAAVVAPAGTLTGATLAANVLASSLTSVGTLTGGATGSGFTINLGTSTVSGNLATANLAGGSGASSSTFWRGDGTWATPAGSGNVTTSVTLTANRLVLGNGTTDLVVLASLGTTATLLHGNAAGAPTFGSVVSADLNITPTICTNQFVTTISAAAAGTCATATLASAQFANQGTTITVLHGNAAGNPAFSSVVSADLNLTTTSCSVGTFVTAIAATGIGTCASFSGALTITTLNLNGSSSGAVSIKPQAAAGTYNFNLPTTAGTSSQILTSGGGGSAPMTWTDWSVGSGCIPTGLGTATAGYFSDCATVSGTANAIILTPAFGATPASPATFTQYRFLAASNNAAATTIKIGASGTAQNVYQNGVAGALALIGGEIVAGNWYTATYDSTLNSSMGGWRITDGILTAGVAGTVRCLSIENFGGAGDNSTFNDAAWNALLATAGPNDTCIQFGSGIFKFSSGISRTVTADKTITIKGAGKVSTKLLWSGSSGGLTLGLSSVKSTFDISDISFETTNTSGGGTGLSITNSMCLGSYPSSSIRNVNISGHDGGGLTQYWTSNFYLQGQNNVNISGLDIYGDQNVTPNGLTITGVNSPACAVNVVNISDSNFFGVLRGVYILTEVQGVTIRSSNFIATTGSANGIEQASAALNGFQLTVDACNFDVTNIGILQGSNGQQSMAVTNSNFFIRDSKFGIYVDGGHGYSFANNSFYPINSSGGTPTAIKINSNDFANAGTITGNTYNFYNGGSGIAAVGNFLAAGTTGWKVTSNAYYNTTTKNTNNGGAANTVGTTKTISFTNADHTVAGGSTTYFLTTANSNEGSVWGLATQETAVRDLYALVSVAPGGVQTAVVTFRAGGADTSLTCTITGVATTCNDLTHAAALSAGNAYSMKIVLSGTAATAFPAAGVTFVSGE